MMGITETAWDNPWLNDPYAPFTEHSTVTQGSFALVNGNVQGIRLVQDAESWTGFSYKMPSAFDLTKAATISVRVAYGGWNAHYANFYILVKSGDNMVNAINFAKQYNTYEPNYNGVTPVELGVDKETGLSTTLNVNFKECWVEIDVAALMEATGFTTIDEIYFGQKSTGFQLTIDEIYYTVPLEEVKVEFTKDNTTAGQHTLEDTEEGLKMTGPAWAVSTSKFTLSNAVDLSEISTITIRFKTNTGAVLVYWNEVIDSTYGNLNSPHTECLISSTVDEEGYTVLVLDAAKLAEKHAISELTGIHFKKNNAATIVYLDYVLFDFK